MNADTSTLFPIPPAPPSKGQFLELQFSALTGVVYVVRVAVFVVVRVVRVTAGEDEVTRPGYVAFLCNDITSARVRHGHNEHQT